MRDGTARQEEPNARDEAPLLVLIEDDRGIRETLEEFLVDAGYRVEATGSAATALARADAGPRPSLIVLDLMMPTMDGWQFRVEQRKRPRLADVPVVVISADWSAKAAAIDADAFVRKPFEFAHLHGVIERLLLANARKQFEGRARELERLRALGTLVAGVAHEINNPLTFVSANLELAQRDWTKMLARVDVPREIVERMARALDGARLGSDRIENVVRALSRFSRAENEAPEALDVHHALESAITLAAGQIHDRARLVRDFEPAPHVMGCESRLGQVFLNLLINAGQAIPPGDAENQEIRISTGRIEDRVFIEIGDTGPGIPQEILPRIFEPFFTTKAAGEGTGLGLSLSKDIVVAHGGTIEARSTLGVGSAFRIELPAMATTLQVVPRPNERPSSRPSRPPLQFGSRRIRILVVDDEPLVGAVFEAALPEFEVVFHSDARTALAAVSEPGVVFDAVISDSRMPGLGGEAFFDGLARARPDLVASFFFATGTVDQAELRRLADRSPFPTLTKPFTVAELRARLGDVLALEHPSPETFTAAPDTESVA